MSGKGNKTSQIEGDLILESPESAEGFDGTSLFAEALPDQAARLMVVEGILALIVRDVSFHDFVRELLLLAMKVVKCEAGSILEYRQSEERFFFRAAAGLSSEKITAFTIHRGQGVVGHVFESRQPMVLSDTQESKIHLKAIQDSVGFSTRNIVALPLVIRGKVYGVLELINRMGEPTFTDRDLELLTQVCLYLARAIEIRLMIAGQGRKTRG